MIQLPIGEMVDPETRPHSTFEIVIHVMHGDADHEEDKSFFGGFDEVIPGLEILSAVFNLSWNDGCDQDKIETAVKSTKMDAEEAWAWYCDHVGYDVSYGDAGLGIMAAPMKVTAFWWDEGCNKFNVNIIGMKTERTF